MAKFRQFELSTFGCLEEGTLEGVGVGDINGVGLSCCITDTETKLAQKGHAPPQGESCKDSNTGNASHIGELVLIHIRRINAHRHGKTIGSLLLASATFVVVVSHCVNSVRYTVNKVKGEDVASTFPSFRLRD